MGPISWVEVSSCYHHFLFWLSCYLCSLEGLLDRWWGLRLLLEGCSSDWNRRFFLRGVFTQAKNGRMMRMGPRESIVAWPWITVFWNSLGQLPIFFWVSFWKNNWSEVMKIDKRYDSKIFAKNRGFMMHVDLSHLSFTHWSLFMFPASEAKCISRVQ